MKEIKFLQTGDLHLEHTFKNMGFTQDLARRRRNELKDIFSNIIRIASEEKVDLLLITGDLFEHQNSTKALMRFLKKLFQRIPRVKVIITPGNHDPALPDSYYRTFPWPENVHIFLKENWEHIDFPGLDLRVYGLGWNQWEIKRPLLRDLNIDSPREFNLIMLHGDTFGCLGESTYLPISENDLRNCKGDYVALGHIHQFHRIPAKGKIVAHYAGSPEPLSFGEHGEHGVLVGTLNKEGVNVKIIPTAKRKFIQKSLRIKSSYTLEEVCEKIKNSAGKEARKNNIFRFYLNGEFDESLGLNKDIIRDKLKDDFFFLDIKDKTVPDYDLEEIIRENLHSALGIYALKMKEEMDRADGREKEILENSLYYGLEALLGKKVELR